MQELVKSLGARTMADFADAWPHARSELEGIFDPEVWGIQESANEYTDENYRNIWNNEIRKPVRRILTDSGLTPTDFAAWLGGIHFVSIAVYRRGLFEKYQDNRGWRVLILSVPPVSGAAVGLASHYQNAQNHDHLAKVSALLFDHIASAVQQQGLQLPGRRIAKADWTDDSLFPQPISQLDGADLSTLASDGRLFMRDVRTTTVKKILASMISVQPIDLNDPSGALLGQTLAQLQAIGRVVA